MSMHRENDHSREREWEQQSGGLQQKNLATCSIRPKKKILSSKTWNMLKKKQEKTHTHYLVGMYVHSSTHSAQNNSEKKNLTASAVNIFVYRQDTSRGSSSCVQPQRHIIMNQWNLKKRKTAHPLRRRRGEQIFTSSCASSRMIAWGVPR